MNTILLGHPVCYDRCSLLVHPLFSPTQQTCDQEWLWGWWKKVSDCIEMWEEGEAAGLYLEGFPGLGKSIVQLISWLFICSYFFVIIFDNEKESIMIETTSNIKPDHKLRNYWGTDLWSDIWEGWGGVVTLLCCYVPVVG